MFRTLDGLVLRAKGRAADGVGYSPATQHLAAALDLDELLQRTMETANVLTSARAEGLGCWARASWSIRD